jgi:hypothetical protein
MRQFRFECCPLVQEISSAVHDLPCFGGGFSLCLFTGISTLGIYFFAPPPFSGAGTAFHQPLPAVSVLCRFSIYFSVLRGSLALDAAHWLRDELCDLLSALLWGVAYHPPALHFPDSLH